MLSNCFSWRMEYVFCMKLLMLGGRESFLSFFGKRVSVSWWCESSGRSWIEGTGSVGRMGGDYLRSLGCSVILSMVPILSIFR